MLLSVGPLALPLIWWRSETSSKWKLTITALVLILTYALYMLSVFVLQILNEQIEILQGLGM